MGLFSGYVFVIELGPDATFFHKAIVHKTITNNKGCVSFPINDKVKGVSDWFLTWLTSIAALQPLTSINNY